MSETILIVLGAVGFLAIGAGLGYWLAQLRTRGETARADEVRQEFRHRIPVDRRPEQEQAHEDVE